MSLPLTFYVFSELANEAWICSTCFVVTAIRSLHTIHILFLWFLFFIPLTMVYNWNIFILSKTMKTYIHQWCLYSGFFFFVFLGFIVILVFLKWDSCVSQFGLLMILSQSWVIWPSVLSFLICWCLLFVFKSHLVILCPFCLGCCYSSLFLKFPLCPDVYAPLALHAFQ